jgi:hypothetical protein
MRKLILALAVVPAISGCQYLSKPESTHFDAVDNGFEFRAIADAAYPEHTENGESWRMKWLEQKLRQTGTCPTGYTITSREPVLFSTGTLGSIYNVYYEGRCI